jgi:hypothetical protein
MSLVELSFVVALLGVVLSGALAVLWSVQTGLMRQTDRSQSNDQVRLAIQELEKEIRSGNVFYDPSLENDASHGIYPNMAMRIYTQANGNIRNPSSRCEQWRIQNQQLQRRWWTTNWRDNPSVLVSGWTVIADHVVNQTASPPVPAFTLDTSQSSYGNRILNVAIVVNERSSSGANVETDTSITGRDTEYGYPATLCADIPPY